MTTNPSPEEYLPLLRSQRNRAFEWVRDAGLDPSRFAVGAADWGKTRCNRFAYREAEYFFDVSTARGRYSVRYSPGASELLTHQMDVAVNFDSLESAFKAWLSYLRREVEAPDLWELIRSGGRALALAGAPSNNDPFTEVEREQVVVAIGIARTYLIDAGVDADAADVKEQLEYLTDTSRRSGRRDWYFLAFGVLFDIAVAVALDPDAARRFIEAVLTAVSRIRLG
jgi:hypothetical protein